MFSQVAFAQNLYEDAKSKVWVIERSWQMLLQTEQHDGSKGFLRLQGELSPCVRASANAVGETIAQVVESCVEIPECVNQIFKMKLSVSETDSAPANFRAEAARSKASQSRRLGATSSSMRPVIRYTTPWSYRFPCWEGLSLVL